MVPKYTTGKTPFTIDGSVDFRDMSRPMANLNLLAQNYTLLDAKRTRESLVYGKVYADFRATVKGPIYPKVNSTFSILA